MAGYAGHSMSNNAVDAYERGIVPLSKIPGKPRWLTKTLAHDLDLAEEWHHTSNRYNRTDFYCPNCLAYALGTTNERCTRTDEYGAKHRLAHDSMVTLKAGLMDTTQPGWLLTVKEQINA